MIHWLRTCALLVFAVSFGPIGSFGQIDPVKRELIQVGYNGAFEGHSPLSAYAFYYGNYPGFQHTNLTLRLAVAPTYLDSELGIKGVLSELTDVGVGIAGGGFADSYNEIRTGKYIIAESFDGYGGELNTSVYHLFNPGQLIPLNGLLRGSFHYASYDEGSGTAQNFQLPADMGIFNVRTGLRWGGREPTLYPDLAMELSAWYQGEFRTRADTYGFNDRSIESQSHLFWGDAMLAYTLPEWKHSFSLTLLAGTSIQADRFSAYRLGGFLPMIAEFPLSLPGYYYQELSAEQFVLFYGTYIIPLEKSRRWNISLNGATAAVDYLPGLEQPGKWNSGVGAGIFYTSPTWRVMLGYGYGIDAIRTDGRGAHTLGLVVQLDLTPAKEAFFKPEPPGRWRGIQRIFGVFGS